MGALQLKFLGELEVVRNGERLELPASRKTRALLQVGRALPELPKNNAVAASNRVPTPRPTRVPNRPLRPNRPTPRLTR